MNNVADWKYLQSLRCPRVEAAEGKVYCMVCGVDRATGHVEIDGGPYDQRLILLTCPGCGHPENEERVMEALYQQYRDGYFDPITGGPGINGAARLRHDEHIDTLDDWREEAQHA